MMKRIEFQVTVHQNSRLGKELSPLSSGRERSRRIQELATEALFAASIGAFVRTAAPAAIQPAPPTVESNVEPPSQLSEEIAAIAIGLMGQLENLKEDE
ncbi:MAG: hypothetical protein ING75_16810 [Rhodocyclaceae bacterium]|nr:hypothetical protein [Rhodocyclaceae bacterium]